MTSGFDLCSVEAAATASGMIEYFVCGWHITLEPDNFATPSC